MLHTSRLGLNGCTRSRAPVPVARWLRGTTRRAVVVPCHSQTRAHHAYGEGNDEVHPRGRPSSAAGRGRGRSSGDWRRSHTGAGRGRTPPGGSAHTQGDGSDPDDLNAYTDLPSLVDAVGQRAEAWAAARDFRTFKAAFSFIFKIGMRADEPSRDGDPRRRAALLHAVMRTLAAAYLPLVLADLRQPDDCVLPLWACAKAGYWGDGLAEALMVRLARDGGEVLQRAKGRDHARLWWSLSEAPPGALRGLPVAVVLHASEERLLCMGPSDLNPQDCSNILLAAARLQQQGSEALLHHMAACLCEQLPGAEAQALANSLYSLGKLAEECGHKPRQQDLQRLAGELAARLAVAGQQHSTGAQAFKPQQLSNMLWGCAKLGYTDSALLQPLVAVAGRAAGRMDAQGLANSLYALAVLGCSGEEYAPALQLLMAAMADRLRHLQCRTEFEAQELSNTPWALTSLQPPGSKELAHAATSECQRRGFANFTAQQLSNAAWALAKLGCSDLQDWYAAAVEAAMQPAFMRAASAQGQSNLLYALALVRHRPPAALLAGMAASQQLHSQAIPQHCANSLWALAILYGSNLDDQGEDAQTVLRLVEALAGRLEQLLLRAEGEEMTEQHLANSMWALAVMGPAVLSRHSSLVEGLLWEVVRRWEAGQGSCFSVEATVQLWQAQLELAHAGYGGGRRLSRLRNAVKDATESIQQQQRGHSTSQLQRQVHGALTRLQRRQQPAGSSSPAILGVEAERWVPELCCWVDIVVELEDGRRVAMEVDGPTHFLANQPHTHAKDGRTQLRDRQLARVFGRGNVVCVPYWEWNARKGQAAQEEYLCRLLTTPLPAARGGASPAPDSSAPEPQRAASRDSSGGRGQEAMVPALEPAVPSPPAPEPQLADSNVRQRPKARAGQSLSSPTRQAAGEGAKRRPRRAAPAPPAGPAPPSAPEPQSSSSGQQPQQGPASGRRLLVPRNARRKVP